jgi:hypothetical protein
MENNDHFLETGKGDFDKNDIYYPCNRVEKFASRSYYFLPKYLFVKNYSLIDMFVHCDSKSPDNFFKNCFQSIGMSYKYLRTKIQLQIVTSSDM